jgi:hypothetical protein
VKNLFATSIVILLMAFAVDCGSGSSQGGSSTDVSGSWAITTVDSGNSSLNSTLNASLVSSVCYTPTGYPTASGGLALALLVNGPSCFIADSSTGQGSISGTGDLFYPPQLALIGVPSNPIPPNSPSSLQLLFIEAGPNDQYAVFNGSGTITGGTMTGTWSCNANVGVSGELSICAGMSGTFSGSKQ